MIAAAAPRLSTLTPVATSGVKTDIRPNVEWWEVNGQHFDSTADMVKNASLPPTGLDATYHFRDKTTYTPEDARHDTINGLVGGAGAGALIGGAGALALNLVAGVFTIFTGGLFGMPAFVSVGLPALVGAGIGAVIGAVEGRKGGKEDFEQGSQISGKVVPGTAGPTFYVGGHLDNAVDMASFATAQPAAAAPPVAPVAKWKDALKGAAIGAALPFTVFVPLLGIFIPAAVGARAGAALTPRGGMLGAAAGVGITAGSIAAGHTSLGVTGLAIGAGVGAAAGALLGPVVLPRMRQAEAEDGVTRGQWWRSYTEGQN